jgi:hypothetical protein
MIREVVNVRREAIVHLTSASAEAVLEAAGRVAGLNVSTISRVVRTTGTDVRGPFVRLDIGSGDHALETTLRGTALEVDWVSGQNMIFNLGEVQTAAGGAKSIRTITGYVTDQLAVNVRQPGYLQRLADTVGGRLGGQWMARLEASGNRTHLILERAP